MIIYKNAVDQSVYLYITEDAGSASPGDPKTGLAYGAITSASYVRHGAARTNVVLATLASSSAAHSDGGFIEVDATNMPGIYRFDVPDAAWVVGTDGVHVVVEPGNNAVCESTHIDLLTLQVPASGTAAISTVADSAPDGFVITTGTGEVNDEDNTHALDGVLHQLSPSDGTTDAYYIFNVGGNGVPVSIAINGYANANGDSFAIFARNFGLSAWEQIGTINGTNQSIILSYEFPFTNAHVGTGANLGEVWLRYYSTDGTEISIDRILCSYSVVATSVGYANGAIWIDTGRSNTNTEVYVDGTADNPVSTLAAGMTLSASLGINKFQLAPNSSIVFVSDMTGYVLKGEKWWLDAGGQNMTNVYLWGALISGTITGTSNPVFDTCRLEDLTTIPFTALGCSVAGNITATAAGEWHFAHCFSSVAGAGTPVFDFGVAVGDSNVNIRSYSGGWEFLNMGQSGTDKMSIEGFGQFIMDVSCIAGEVEVRGSFKKTDNTAGAVTINEVANIKTDVIHDGYVRASTSNTLQLATSASSVDGAYDPARLYIESGTGEGQTRLIYQYTGSTRVAVMDRNWKVEPDITSRYRIVSDAGREHVNEGLAQAGSTTTTIKLNTLASDEDNAYIGQLVFIRSGTGEDQVGLVGGYNGTTKVATLADGASWAVTPDDTSGYAMLPNHIHSLAQSVAALLDASAAVDGYTPRQVLGVLLAALGGEVSGAATNEVILTNPDGTQTRITATVDENGNRSAITLSFTGI